jgi:uncharacterized phage protein gp47/JayE
MSDFGLTDSGFVIKRLPDIVAELEQAFRDEFGEIDVSASSVFGQIIGVTAKPIADLWELMGIVYLSQSPTSAEGVQLDNVAQYTGITRLGATATRGEVVMYSDGTTVPVPAGTEVSDIILTKVYELEAAVTIQASSVVQTLIDITTAVSGIEYKVTVNSTDYTYTAGGGDTPAMIATQLVTAINTGPKPEAVTGIDHSDGTLTVIADDKTTTFSIAVTDDDSPPGSNIEIDEIGTPGVFRGQDAGDFPAPATSVTVIDTPVSGLDRVSNLLDLQTGRDVETDAELRLRRIDSLQIGSVATLAAIRSRLLQDVDDVSEVAIYENRTDVTDGDGRPPHSFESVVVGGDPQDIGQMIWDTKPAGIQTFGNQTAVDVVDSNGDTQQMFFSRPVSMYAYVKVRFDGYDEETFPSDGIDTIKAAILEYGNTLRIGEDMIRDRFYAPIFNSGVAGIGVITTLEIGLTDDPEDVPTDPGQSGWQTTTIAVSAAEHAVFALIWGTSPPNTAIDVQMNP